MFSPVACDGGILIAVHGRGNLNQIINYQYRRFAHGEINIEDPASSDGPKIRRLLTE